MRKIAIVLAAALTAAVPATAANLVTNGSFETGDFTGWSQFGDTSFTGVTFGIFFQPPTDGAFQADFGPTDGFGGITQSLTSSSTSYTVSFDLGQSGGAGNYVDFGGSTILANVADTGGAWVHYSFVVSSAANPTLTFGFYNPPSYYALDNVVVTSNVPEAATWALMIAGFAMTGLAVRRRRTVLAA